MSDVPRKQTSDISVSQQIRIGLSVFVCYAMNNYCYSGKTTVTVNLRSTVGHTVYFIYVH
jgi:hypothetical protein